MRPLKLMTVSGACGPEKKTFQMKNAAAANTSTRMRTASRRASGRTCVGAVTSVCERSLCSGARSVFCWSVILASPSSLAA